MEDSIARYSTNTLAERDARHDIFLGVETSDRLFFQLRELLLVPNLCQFELDFTSRSTSFRSPSHDESSPSGSVHFPQSFRTLKFNTTAKLPPTALVATFSTSENYNSHHPLSVKFLSTIPQTFPRIRQHV